MDRVSLGGHCLHHRVAMYRGNHCLSLVGVVGASLLWSIGELFEQKKRVEKGWFPMNPKRKDQYQTMDGSEPQRSTNKSNNPNAPRA